MVSSNCWSDIASIVALNCFAVNCCFSDKSFASYLPSVFCSDKPACVISFRSAWSNARVCNAFHEAVKIFELLYFSTHSSDLEFTLDMRDFQTRALPLGVHPSWERWDAKKGMVGRIG